MKKFLAMLIALMLLAACVPALAATQARVTEGYIATRSGPGTKYTEPGSFLSYGSQVTVHTKVWDHANEIYWVQVEFTNRGERYRAYTGSWRLDVNLNSVPDEIIEGYSWLTSNTCGYAGPGYDYHYYGDIQLYRNGDCRIIEVENNFAMVETSSSSQGLTRVWVPLSAIYGGSEYYGRDTFTDYYPGYDDGPTLLPEDDGPTLIPGDNNGWSGNNGGWSGSIVIDPIGQYVTVCVDSGHARAGPGTEYESVNYIFRGDVLLVLDSQMGSTGKDWYQVRINGRLCWVSSGLLNVCGYTNGTAHGVPIILDDPLADYPQSSTHLVGRWICIGANSAHVREEPSTDTPTVAYVFEYECYEILDCRIGNTGKVWYKIYVDGVYNEYGWISSGLATLLDD